MKINYRRAILRIFLIMSAMFVVIAITSGCMIPSLFDGSDEAIGGSEGGSGSKGGSGSEGGSGSKGGDEAVVLTCEEGHGYKIVFADKKFEKAFVIAGKDGDLNRTIDVKFDQLTRANGFGAAMPELKSLYASMAAANADEGLKVKENDDVIGFWGDYSAGLSRFILGLNIADRVGDSDGSGPAIAAVEATMDAEGHVGKPAEDAHGFSGASFGTRLTSGPGLGVGDVFVPYDGTTVEGGAFVAEIEGKPAVDGVMATTGHTYTGIGRLEENLFSELDVWQMFDFDRNQRGSFLIGSSRLTLFGSGQLNEGATWVFHEANAGHTQGWQHLFSIKPCDAEVKNGLIAAQLTKAGVAAEIDGTLIDAEKLHLNTEGDPAADEETQTNKISAQLSEANGQVKRELYLDSHIGVPIQRLSDLGFATINYNADADDADVGTFIEIQRYHTVTKLVLACRTIITGISPNQPDLLVAPGNNEVVQPDKFTGGAEKMDCYLGITNFYPEWYEAVVQEYNTANTLDKMFPENEDGHLVVRRYDTQTKTVGLVIADTGDVKLNSEKSHALFYTNAGNNSDQQGKWKGFIEQGGVKTTYGTLKFKFVRPDIPEIN